MSSVKRIEGKWSTGLQPLSVAELAQVQGGVVHVMVDGRTPATMNDLALSMEIFTGNIKLSYVY